MTLPGRALDQHVALISFYSSEMGRRYAAAEMMETFTDANVDGLLAWSLDIADTYAMTDEIGDTVEEARRSLPEYLLHPEDLPSQHGYVHFETTRPILDKHGQTLAATGLGWTSMRKRGDGYVVLDNDVTDPSSAPPQAILLWLFTDPTDPRDHLFGRYPMDEVTRVLRTKGLVLFAGYVVLGETVTAPLDDPIRELSMLPWFVTFFRFLGEPWIDGRPQRPDRAAGKRARRAGRSDPEVRVIALRARPGHGESEHGDPSGEGAGYSHRFFVRGHWRNQWYPSRGEHAPRYIPRYVKGPDSRPLIVKDRVFHVNR